MWKYSIQSIIKFLKQQLSITHKLKNKTEQSKSQLDCSSPKLTKFMIGDILNLMVESTYLILILVQKMSPNIISVCVFVLKSDNQNLR